MKKLYKTFLKIPDNDKISERIFTTRITMSVIAILSCLTVMLSTAFAFFNSNLTRDFKMCAAVWDVVVEESDDGLVRSHYTCMRSLEEGEIYEFTLSPSGTATEGYCIIKITNPANETSVYCTEAFDDDIIVKIQAVAGCRIVFAPRWGKPANYGITEVCANRKISHSFTEPPPPEETTENSGISTEGGETSLTTESGYAPTGSSADTSSDSNTENTTSDKNTSSTNSTETSGAGETSGAETSSSEISSGSSSDATSTSAQPTVDISSSTSGGEATTSSGTETASSGTASAGGEASTSAPAASASSGESSSSEA